MTRLWLAVLIYPMVQAVAFGAGLIAALALTPEGGQPPIVLVVVLSSIVSVAFAWFIAPRMMLRYQRRAQRLRAQKLGAQSAKTA